MLGQIKEVIYMIKNETYDVLKWVSVQLIPALNVLILAIGKIWDMPYYVQIAGTISAIGVFIGAIIYKSSKEFYKDVEFYDDEIGEEPAEVE